MKIILMDWNSIGNLDLSETLKELGHTVIPCPFHSKIGRENREWEENFSKTLRLLQPDFVFSFNYFPIIAKVCKHENTMYYSWVYDSPLHTLYSKTVYYSTNRIFVFDKELFVKLRELKVDTIYYLPLAVNTKRLSNMQTTLENEKYYQSDVSFVGSMYTEPKHRLFERLNTLCDYDKGYLSALIEIQKKVYGSCIIEEGLTPDLLKDMLNSYSVYPHTDGMETIENIYTDYFLLREVTAQERAEIILSLGSKFGSSHSLRLYTHDTNLTFPGVQVLSEVDYYNQMPFVFKGSKINLNITLRSILSGIPLRALDIMGCGGFLISNYQADFLDYFIPNEDFVYYESKNDLLEKIDFYLRHKEERKRIATNGFNKVRDYFDYKIAIKKMLDV